MDGFCIKHLTASVYAIFSSSVRESHSFRTAAFSKVHFDEELRESW